MHSDHESMLGGSLGAGSRRRTPRWRLAVVLACLAPAPLGLSLAQETALPEPIESGQVREPVPAAPDGGPRRRALLVGINDYSATELAGPDSAPGAEEPPASQRTDWPDLRGAVNDVEAMSDMLAGRYGFRPQDVLVLEDQAATRQAILRAIERHLVEPARKGEIIVFYFSGHGSQVRNTRSAERDQLDESIVPADSRLGAGDIRDKELRGLFNRVLAKEACPVVILDSCHSGSGARGLPDGSPARAIRPDLRDVADGGDYGLPIEQRGALVLSAARDDEKAVEVRDQRGRPHGAFTLALLEALRAASASESSRYVFARACAWLGTAGRFQRPVLEGRPERIAEPLFGPPSGGETAVVVAVDRIGRDGQIRLLGGWVDGLAVGSELRALAGEDARARLRVVALDGLQRSRAELVPAPEAGPEVGRGQLFEIASWVAQQRPLGVWIPHTEAMGAVRRFAEDLAASGRRGGVEWVEDPTETTPSHVIRWSGDGFELLGPESRVSALGARPSVSGLIELLPDGARLFVQLPVPTALVQEIEIGPGSRHSAVASVDDPSQATYVLAGRLRGDSVEFAWIRPGSLESDRERMRLPVRSRWFSSAGPESLDETARELRDRVLRLYKVFAWNLLQPAPWARAAFPYRLAITDAGGSLVGDHRLASGRDYSFVLRVEGGAAVDASRLRDRYVYVFAIDGSGNSSLLYPPRFLTSENKVPGASVQGGLAPGRIDLGRESRFDVVEPFGFDTFFLFTSTEPVGDPWLVFEYEGVRGEEPSRSTALARLLAETGSTRRGTRVLATPATWSIERAVYRTTSDLSGEER